MSTPVLKSKPAYYKRSALSKYKKPVLYKYKKPVLYKSPKSDTTVTSTLWIDQAVQAVPAQGSITLNFHVTPANFNHFASYANIFKDTRLREVTYEFRVVTSPLTNIAGTYVAPNIALNSSTVDGLVMHSCMPVGWQAGPANVTTMQGYSDYRYEFMQPDRFYTKVTSNPQWVLEVGETVATTAHVAAKSGWFGTDQSQIYIIGPTFIWNNDAINIRNIAYRIKGVFSFRGLHV